MVNGKVMAMAMVKGKMIKGKVMAMINFKLMAMAKRKMINMTINHTMVQHAGGCANGARRVRNFGAID